MTPVVPDYSINGSKAGSAAAVPASMGADRTACQENQGKASVVIDGQEMTVKYNGSLLEQSDVDEADLWGFAKGHFVLWIKANIVKTTPKTFTLGGEGEAKTFTIKVVDAA